MSIIRELKLWDGRSVSHLRSMHDLFHGNEGYTTALIRLLSDPDLQQGASWLLKCWFESGATLTAEEGDRVYLVLEELEHWQARLHVLQCMPFLPISTDVRERVHEFLQGAMEDSQNFVRACAFHGLYELALQYPEHLEEAEEALQMAMEDGGASVRARARNLLEKGFPSATADS